MYPKRSRCGIVVMVLFLGLAMLLPVAGPAVSGGEPSGNIYLVHFGTMQDIILLEELHLDVLERYDSYWLVKLDVRRQQTLMDAGFVLEYMNARTMVGFDAFRFETRDGEPTLPPSMRISSYPKGVVGYYLVQFIGPIKDAWKTEIETLGGRLHDFIPEFNYIVEMDSAAMQTVKGMHSVRWVGIYQPAYKVHPSLNGATGTIEVNIFTFRGRDLPAMVDEFASLGAEILDVYDTMQNGVIHAHIDASLITHIANFYGVKSLDIEGGNFIANADATWILETDVGGQRTLMDKGITGEGELVTVMDSELRTTHEMFNDPNHAIGDNHRKIQDQYALGGGSLAGGNFHGTHVAGTLAGDAPVTTGGTDWYTYNKNDGHAIKSRLIFQDIDDTDDANGAVSPPANLWDGFTPSYNAGSRIQTNSWGGQTGYTDDALEIDSFTWQNKDFNVLFAMGNSGSGSNTLGEQSEAKNCISVGGVVNSPNHNNMYTSSSRGFADDGRIKPTILGVADGVTSSSNAGDTSYSSMTGTSMATPGIAGQTAQVRQYYSQGFYPSGSATAADQFNPSAALVKGTLINGAVEIAGTGAYTNGNRYPNADQGWGRSKLEDVLFFTGDARKLMSADYSKGFITGSHREVMVSVTDNSIPLEFTLVWTDYPGADNANPAIVNDLDLQVTAPNSNLYKGNAFAETYNPGYSRANPSAANNYWSGSRTEGFDGLNVEEGVLLLPAQNAFPTGTYTIRMSAYNVPQPRQPYALVVTGGLGNAGPVLQLSSPNGGESLTGGSSYPITWSLTDREDSDPNMLVNIYLSTNGGTTYPTTIATNVPNTGSYPWTVNNIDTGTARVKITCTDSGGLTSEDWSYSDFTITASSITASATATGPVGGPTDVAEITLTYTYTGTPTSVNLYYTSDSGMSWELAGSDPSVDGNFNWTVPVAGTYGWLASAVGGGSVEPSPPTGGTAPEASPYMYDPVPPPYSIILTGKAPNSWAFVSFPVEMDGNIQDILNDAALGDGLTTWDVAKGYDSQAKTWKTFRVGYSTALTTIDNTMGVWLHLIANGGDQMLTLSGSAAIPGSAVNIPLYAGWNMVGYPSMTNRQADVTLPAQATMVSVWQATSPYIDDRTPVAVTMSHGNAYWVYVTADCTWAVNP